MTDSIPDNDEQSVDPIRHPESDGMTPLRRNEAARPIAAAQSVAERERIIMAAREAGRARVTPGPSAARSQDFLYDEDGLPG